MAAQGYLEGRRHMPALRQAWGKSPKTWRQVAEEVGVPYQRMINFVNAGHALSYEETQRVVEWTKKEEEERIG
jgi:hypothetical protein